LREAGNEAVLIGAPVPPSGPTVRSEPADATERWLAEPRLAGVCVLDDAQRRAAWQRIARRPGAILPVVSAAELLDPRQRYRLCAEQTLTINTAAAGGNAALLAGTPAGGM
jgi:RHH-type proline utilization regulon transcriptional repressor/proline dehydrogenase/delta 1-pyrroline-5-carboxylate dehydrogenase